VTADTWITRIVVVLGFITALITLWRLLKVDKKQDVLQIQLDGRMSALIKRVDQLTQVLSVHGINIPVSPAPPETEEPK
jgi:hypothetical protein